MPKGALFPQLCMQIISSFINNLKMNWLTIVNLLAVLSAAFAAVAAWRSVWLMKIQSKSNNLNEIFFRINDLLDKYGLKYGIELDAKTMDLFLTQAFGLYEYLSTLVINKQVDEKIAKDLFKIEFKRFFERPTTVIHLNKERKNAQELYLSIVLLAQRWGIDTSKVK